jgi:hypothetical protein
MSTVTRTILSCFAVAAILVVLPGTAAAACSGGAVGDQYCDPLNPSGHSPNGGGGGPGGSSGNGGGGTANASASGSTAGANGTSSGLSEAAAQKADPKTGLPATGVPIFAILGFGVALLASGLALRQVAVPPLR